MLLESPAGWDDILDIKEVCHPDDPRGELAFGCLLRFAFESAGFAVTAAKKPSEAHAVWLIRCQLNRHFTGDSELRQHILDTLRTTGVRLRKSEVTVSRAGNRVQVNFVWEQSAQPAQPI